MIVWIVIIQGFIMKQKGSRDPQAIFDCVSGWGSYYELINL